MNFVNLGISHLARCSLEGYNRHVVSRRPDRPSPSKFPVVAQTCLLDTTRILKLLVESQKASSCSTDHSLPVLSDLKRKCSSRVHFRSEAVGSCKASKRQYVLSKSDFSVSIRKPSVVKTFPSISQIPPFLWIGVSSPSSWD